MIKDAFKKGQLYINYLGPVSALIGSIVATPILISNIGINQWSLFALINILLPIIYFILFGSNQIIRRIMINLSLNNDRAQVSIDLFYKHEKKIILRFFPATIILSCLLIYLNSNSYQTFKSIQLSFFLISIAVLIKIFEIFYNDALNGLKQHYKLNLTTFFVTLFKWITIICLSFYSEVNINILILLVVIFSLILLTIQRIFILNLFKKIKNDFKNQINQINVEFKENNFGFIIILFLLLQQFDKVLVFGILDPLSLSHFGIAFMLSSVVPFLISPIMSYLTPEIYESSEKNLKNRKKNFSRLIILQFFVLILPIILVNFYLDDILNFWLGNTINSDEISFFLIPLSLGALSLSLLNSLKVLFIGENNIRLIKNSLINFLIFFILLTFLLYINILSVKIYLYSWSISIFFLTIYFYVVFFTKNYIVKL